MFALLVSLAVFVPTANAQQETDLTDAAKKELKKLEGKWQLVKLTSTEGEREATAVEAELLLEFKGKLMRIGGKEIAEVRALDPGVDPKCLDFKAVAGMGEIKEGTVYESVYKIDGDTLTWAVYVGAGNKRPANFDAPKDAGTFVVVLKRVKD